MLQQDFLNLVDKSAIQKGTLPDFLLVSLTEASVSS